jgi:hypothetical protein
LKELDESLYTCLEGPSLTWETVMRAEFQMCVSFKGVEFLALVEHYSQFCVPPFSGRRGKT